MIKIIILITLILSFLKAELKPLEGNNIQNGNFNILKTIGVISPPKEIENLSLFSYSCSGLKYTGVIEEGIINTLKILKENVKTISDPYVSDISNIEAILFAYYFPKCIKDTLKALSKDVTNNGKNIITDIIKGIQQDLGLTKGYSNITQGSYTSSVSEKKDSVKVAMKELFAYIKSEGIFDNVYQCYTDKKRSFYEYIMNIFDHSFKLKIGVITNISSQCQLSLKREGEDTLSWSQLGLDMAYINNKDGHYKENLNEDNWFQKGLNKLDEYQHTKINKCLLLKPFNVDCNNKKQIEETLKLTNPKIPKVSSNGINLSGEMDELKSVKELLSRSLKLNGKKLPSYITEIILKKFTKNATLYNPNKPQKELSNPKSVIIPEFLNNILTEISKIRSPYLSANVYLGIMDMLRNFEISGQKIYTEYYEIEEKTESDFRILLPVYNNINNDIYKHQPLLKNINNKSKKADFIENLINVGKKNLKNSLFLDSCLNKISNGRISEDMQKICDKMKDGDGYLYISNNSLKSSRLYYNVLFRYILGNVDDGPKMASIMELENPPTYPLSKEKIESYFPIDENSKTYNPKIINLPSILFENTYAKNKIKSGKIKERFKNYLDLEIFRYIFESKHEIINLFIKNYLGNVEKLLKNDKTNTVNITTKNMMFYVNKLDMTLKELMIEYAFVTLGDTKLGNRDNMELLKNLKSSENYKADSLLLYNPEEINNLYIKIDETNYYKDQTNSQTFMLMPSVKEGGYIPIKDIVDLLVSNIRNPRKSQYLNETIPNPIDRSLAKDYIVKVLKGSLLNIDLSEIFDAVNVKSK